MDWRRGFERSIERQVELNQSRTPDERLTALADLLDAARALAPRDADARDRRRRALAARQRERELWRERCRRILASERVDTRQGL